MSLDSTAFFRAQNNFGVFTGLGDRYNISNKNLTYAYKRELPALTFYSMEHPVLARCLADIDL